MYFYLTKFYKTKLFKIFITIQLLFFKLIKTDVPVHCKKEQIEGFWEFHISSNIFNPKLNDKQTACGHSIPNQISIMNNDEIKSFKNEYIIKIYLSSDYKIIDKETNSIAGSWTAIYDQAIHVKYKNSEFTTNMKYYKDEKSNKYISNCDKTMYGWYIRDINNKSYNWSCFYGLKIATYVTYDKDINNLNKDTYPVYFERKLSVSNKSNINRNTNKKFKLNNYKKYNVSSNINLNSNKLNYENLHDVVKSLNSMNLSWKAAISDNFKGIKINNLNQHMGFKRKPNNNKLISEYNNHTMYSLLEKSSNKFITHNFGNKTLLNKKLFKDLKLSTYNYNVSSREIDSNNTSYNQVSKYIDIEIEDIDINNIALNWDWSNVNGINYISNSESQGKCGSCYVFSTLGSLESRLRILTNNQDKTKFSRQFPLSCNYYSEGCLGGYPYLVAKFLNENEIIPEECFPYEGSNSNCSKVCDFTKYKKKYTVSTYEYLGGGYGKTTEEQMIKEIRARGPIPGHIHTHWTFSYYKEGIYTTTKLIHNENKNPSTITMLDRSLSWEDITHGILIVGYGEENGIKYWKCKNSWGDNWGEKGYFRIQRGIDECGIESMGDAFRIKVEDRN